MPVPPAPGRSAHDSRRNSLLFREVNQRIRDVSATWGNGPEPLGFLCECGNPDCHAVVSMTLGEYDAIRDERSSFVLLRGHERPAAKNVAGPPHVPLARLSS